MASRPPFPGMNPYLENPSFWPEVHSWLIVGLARALNPQITPKYRAAIDTRVVIAQLGYQADSDKGEW